MRHKHSTAATPVKPAFRNERDALQRRAISSVIFGLVLASIGSSLFFTGQNLYLYAATGVSALSALLLLCLLQTPLRLTVGYAGASLLAYSAWYTIATLTSSVPYISAIELGTLVSALALFLVWRLHNSTTQLFSLHSLLLTLGLALSLGMIFQVALGFSPSAMFINPNSAAGYLNYLWPAPAVAFLHSGASEKRRLLNFSILFVIWFALAIDGSRGALIAAALGLAIIAAAGFRAFAQPWPTWALLISFPAALTSANWINDNALASQAASLSAPTLAGESRLRIWSAAWEMIREYPFTGFGPGTFWAAYPAWRSPNDQSDGFFVHNDYLEIWLESGFPGLAIFLALGLTCLAMYVRIWRGFRRGTATQSSFSTSTICFTGLFAVAVHGLVTFNFQMPSFLVIAVILAAELERTSDSPKLLDHEIARPLRRPLPIVSLVLVFLVPFGHFARTPVALEKTQYASALIGNAYYKRGIDTLRSARSIWSTPDIPWYLEAEALIEFMRESDDLPRERTSALVSRASKLLKQAHQRNPWRSKTLMLQGFLINDHPALTSGNASDMLRQAVTLDPRNIEARYALSQLLQRTGNTGAAIQVLQHGLEISYSHGQDLSPLKQRLRQLSRATPQRP